MEAAAALKEKANDMYEIGIGLLRAAESRQAVDLEKAAI
jgi:hypothetical protein